MSTLQPAARYQDPIAHTPLLAMIGKVAAGLVVGAAVGAAAGALAVAVVGTGGLGAVVAGAVISSVIMQAGGNSLVEGVTNFICDGIDSLFPPEICGLITTACSDNVFINDIRAARAVPECESVDDDNTVKCGKHTPRPDQYVAEGSSTVYINNAPAHRVKDRSTCDAKTDQGSPNVFIGGEPEATREITSEMPAWLEKVSVVAGIAMALCTRNWRSIPGKLACLGLNMGIGMAADAAVGAAFGRPVHAASGAKLLDGSDDSDFAFPARLPLEWTRRYNSMDRRDGLLGPGWSVPVSVQLKVNQPGDHPNLYIDEQGREVPFDSVAPGESLTNTAEGYRLGRSEGGHYIIEVDEGLYHEFGPARSEAPHTLELTGIEDRNGNAIRLHRDDDGRLTALADSAGRLYQCHYDQTHPQRLAAIELRHRDAADESEPDYLVRYGYDGRGRLVSVSDRAGVETRRFGWHDDGPGAGLMASHTLPDGLTAHYRWEAFADHPRVVEQWDDGGNRWQAQYDLVAGATRVTDQLGRTQQWRWNARYALTEYTNAAGESWRIVWNDAGLMAGAVQPNGGEWRFDYDERGNLTRQTDPNGAVTGTEWLLERAQPRRDTDALGNSIEYRYDSVGNLVETIDDAGTTAWTLDRFGQPLVRTAANGSQTRWNWNDAGLIVNATDCSGQVTHYEYDRDGNLIAMTDALGQRSEYHYDPLGRVTAAQLPDDSSRKWQWTEAGRLAAAIDAADNATSYYWDDQGRLTRRTDAAGRPVDYQYDAPGNLIALANENGETYRFEHDAADRVVAQISLDGKRTELTLDKLGLPVEVREAAGSDAELTTLLERDPLGQLCRKITADTVTTYHRDVIGQLVKIERANPHGEPLDSIEFAYDAAGNLVSETQQFHRDGKIRRHALTHRYDALGNRLATVLPDGRVIHSLYYGSGHLHQINIDGRVICDFERDALHREISRTQGGLNHRTRYDPLSRKIAQGSRPPIDNFVDPANGLEKRYQYDANGELVRRADTLFGQIEHQYDPTGRILGSETVKTGKAGYGLNELFAYDAAANLVTPAQSATLSRGQVRHNRITVFEDKRYFYDEHGRLTEKRIGSHTRITLKWNAEHQLIESRTEKHNVTQRSRYEYDALGRRIAKHDDFGTTFFVWDGMRLLQEKRRHHTLTYFYQPGSYEPLARVDDRDEGFRQPNEQAQIYHFHNHVNGAPEELTDEAGNIVWQARYATWGNLALQTAEPKFLPGRHIDSDPQSLRMQGQYEDAETGLYYNTFRYYDPGIGRFISEDPIGLLGGLNLYQFAPNADSWIDPWGWVCQKKVNALRNGQSGTIVTVKNKREADELLRAAFPGARKVSGIGNQPIAPQNRRRIPNKIDAFENRGPAYHKDYYIDPTTGRVAMHGPGKPWHDRPHIDINRGSNGVKDIVHIVIGS